MTFFPTINGPYVGEVVGHVVVVDGKTMQTSPVSAWALGTFCADMARDSARITGRRISNRCFFLNKPVTRLAFKSQIHTLSSVWPARQDMSI